MNAYRIQVHGMKSAAATIGIVPLAGMAKMLEYAARDGQVDTIHAMQGVFLAEWRSYRVKLQGIFGIGEQVEKEGSADEEMLRAMFAMLRPALEDFDVDAMDEIVEKINSYQYSPEIEEELARLTAAVKDLDSDSAEKIMAEVENRIAK